MLHFIFHLANVDLTMIITILKIYENEKLEDEEVVMNSCKEMKKAKKIPKIGLSPYALSLRYLVSLDY